MSQRKRAKFKSCKVKVKIAVHVLFAKACLLTKADGTNPRRVVRHGVISVASLKADQYSVPDLLVE